MYLSWRNYSYRELRKGLKVLKSVGTWSGLWRTYGNIALATKCKAYVLTIFTQHDEIKPIELRRGLKALMCSDLEWNMKNLRKKCIVNKMYGICFSYIYLTWIPMDWEEKYLGMCRNMVWTVENLPKQCIVRNKRKSG